MILAERLQRKRKDVLSTLGNLSGYIPSYLYHPTLIFPQIQWNT
jgi:hypothetical protein